MGPILISFRNGIFGLNKPKFLFSQHNDVPSFYLPSLAFIGGDFFPPPFPFVLFLLFVPSPFSCTRAIARLNHNYEWDFLRTRKKRTRTDLVQRSAAREAVGKT